MPLTKAERETVVLMNDADDTAIVTTYQRPVITRLSRNEAAELVEEMPDGGATFRIPAKLVSFRNPRKQSEESRAAAADRMAHARAARQPAPLTQLEPY